jgi:hypothetical protein
MRTIAEMAVDNRSQLAVSWLSLRRPDFVNE